MNNPLCILKIISHGNEQYTYEIYKSDPPDPKAIDVLFKEHVNNMSVDLICKKIEGLANQYNKCPQKNGNMHYESFVQLGKALYHEIIPKNLQIELQKIKDPIIISTNNPNIYWELLYDGDEFWGMKYALSRQLLISTENYNQYNRSEVTKKWGFDRKKALIIASNPNGDIPQVAIECQILLKWLKEKGFEFTYISPEEATYTKVITELEKGDYEIFHYAGHLITNEGKESCLLIEEKNISCEDVEKHADVCKIVYLSCCESAVGVESFANAFLKKEARIVIGSIFEVNDQGSSKFAEQVYDNIFQGKTIGENLKQTRLLIKNDPNYGATWASFIMYGDPRFQFVNGGVDLLQILISHIVINYDQINKDIKRASTINEFSLLDELIHAFPNLKDVIKQLSTNEIYELYNAYENLISKLDEDRFGISYVENKAFLTDLSIKFCLERIEKIYTKELLKIYVQEKKLLPQNFNIDNIISHSFFTLDSEGYIRFFDKHILRKISADGLYKDLSVNNIYSFKAIDIPHDNQKFIAYLINGCDDQYLKEIIKKRLYNWIRSTRFEIRDRLTFLGRNCISILLKLGEDFKGMNFEGANFGGANLNGACFENVNLCKVNLGGADLTGANFKNSNLNDANLAGSTLKDSELTDVNLIRAILNGAEIIGAKLKKANFKNAKMNGVNLKSSILDDVNMNGVVMGGTVFTKVETRGECHFPAAFFVFWEIKRNKIVKKK